MQGPKHPRRYRLRRSSPVKHGVPRFRVVYGLHVVTQRFSSDCPTSNTT